jgi:hypothetical protein
VRIRTRKLSLLSSFRASHDDISIGNIAAFTKKAEDSQSSLRRLEPSRSISENPRNVEKERSSDGATIKPWLHVGAAEQPSSQHDSKFSRAFEPILLPFAARLGDRPSSSCQQQAAEVKIQVTSAENNRKELHRGAKGGLSDHRQQRNLTKSLDLGVGVLRPKSAPAISTRQRPSGELQVQSSSKQQVVNRGALSFATSRSSAAHSAIAASTSQGRRGSKPARAEDQVQVAKNVSGNEEFELQGAELEALLQKQLQLVSPHFLSSGQSFN